jgi:transcriptional regulator with XRE-family HTH domain
MLSSIKKSRKPMRGLDPALSVKIKQLRASLGMVQSEFARKLEVTRTQVGAWEKGDKERPSMEKLLQMADLAPSRDDRMWFRRKAGLDVEALKLDLLDETMEQTRSLAAEPTLKLPVFGSLSLDRSGNIAQVWKGALALSSSRFARRDSISCLMSDRRPPWVDDEEELVLVDRSIVEPKDLWRKPAAVFFSNFPASFASLSRTAPFPLGWSFRPLTDVIDPTTSSNLRDLNQDLYPDREFTGELEKRQVQLLEEAVRPGFLTGWIHVIYGDVETLSLNTPANDPWRLALRVHAPWSGFSPKIALSDWQINRPPNIEDLLLSHVKLLDGVRILGEVVGWIGAQSPSTAVD